VHILAEFAFRKALTGTQVAGDDQLPQTICGELGAAAVVVFRHGGWQEKICGYGLIAFNCLTGVRLGV
jgi:hypothetical protein